MVKKKLQKIIPGITPNARRKRKLVVSLRTVKDEARYVKAKQEGKARRPFLEEPRLRQWEHWAIIDNDFPYSTAFKIHHMLIPLRVVNDKNLSEAEREELDLILDALAEENYYNCMLMNFKNTQSVLEHFHLHLLIYKDSRLDLEL